MRRTASASRDNPLEEGLAPRAEMAPRVAIAITTVVICGFFAVAVTYVLQARHTTFSLVFCFALLLLLLGLQLCHSFPSSMPRAVTRHSRWTLAAQTLLTYAPFTVFDAAWLGMPGFLAASSLLVLRTALGWFAFGTVVVTTGLLQFAVGFGVGHLAYNCVATSLTGLVVYGLSRLADLIREVQTAREELARLAITQERLRFARDLHDLLGYSLSTITLKCELTYRFIRLDPERAETEITEILQTARQALADVRAVASSYLHMSLRREVSSAESLLQTIGIRTEVRIDAELPAGHVDTVMATVLREGITNVLQHSKAQHCVIEAAVIDDRVRITVANDGVGAECSTLHPVNPGGGGSGLNNLITRVGALGGQLTAGVREDGWFQLTAEVPRQPGDCAPSGDEQDAAALPSP
ncbi:sensor histidine kinase [Streptomyces kebangsaanensis]|uniref:sensor histidine kinase n=1 Tax=Streptomyces kebangsaanensis TaxID=864058 RepID=UPI0009A12628|nr:histidine kinase [Streptomyces kebangsaanensis]